MQTENWICQTEKYWNEKRPWWLGVASKQNQSRLARPWLQIETRVTLILGNIQNSITARIKYLFKHKLRSVTLPIRSLSVFFLLWCWNPGFNKSAVSLFTLIIHSFRALNRIRVCTLVEAWRSPKLTEEALNRWTQWPVCDYGVKASVYLRAHVEACNCTVDISIVWAWKHADCSDEHAYCCDALSPSKSKK